MKDEKFMKRALELAKRGRNAVSPNPLVSAVLVKNGRIIAEDWHRKFGEAHAEVNLLRRAAKKLHSFSGCILYLTLEPCVEFPGKKTPACVNQIIESGIKRVVIAMKDPNPEVSGRGIKALKKAGIKVSTGLLQQEAAKLNMPFVTLKIAMTLDGKIATKTGDSKWITSEKSRRYVKSLRDEHDAVLVGINTILRDNPELKGRRKQPLRIILDSHLHISRNAKVLRDSNVLLVTTDRAPKSKLDYFLKRKIACKVFPSRLKKIPLSPLLRFLGASGINSLFVEGGSEIFGSFIDARLFGRVILFIAPKIIGGRDAKPAVGGEGIALLKKAIHISRPTLRKIGSDFLLDCFEFVNVKK
ncbi:bifunctional diaminohydroxyphosphoribosylaminopyrimidine deaminase/5-amino-6-(5-phosphoribosylamino)uracil reductase RibD [Candidatus Peregrinibacteria bacterium]|nr:bifunctional diaminohydroxyphosphoribosylaminopyrimidine deaminase/5-amino-6-(5-phosphoribosylamino)uracil reductase RibD [Candidatus Peregrinibacteria bacterium]